MDVNKMKRSESETWNIASSVIAVSKEDALVIQKKSNQKKVYVVPNGADLEYFAFTPKKIIDKNSLQFIYVGNFAWMQNTDAKNALRTI
jgi:glycosyltransferase involved in cell wall biosynthesis